MAPKKPTVTSSSTRSARVKGGSNPVVTKGEARTRAARTTLGPAPKQRPMATGGTKGPLQGGTRSPSLKAKPARVGPNLGQQSTSSSAGTRSVRPAATKSSGMTMSGDRAAAIKGAGNPAGPRAPKPAFGPVPTATEARNARNVANRTAKGYGKPSALETNIRNTVGTIKSAAQLAGRGGAFAAGIQAYNTRGGTISEMDPKLAKQIAAMKNKVGPKIVGPKKVGTGKVGTIAQSFDKSFAAARKAGKSKFTFQGKRYNTKMK